MTPKSNFNFQNSIPFEYDNFILMWLTWFSTEEPLINWILDVPNRLPFRTKPPTSGHLSLMDENAMCLLQLIIACLTIFCPLEGARGLIEEILMVYTHKINIEWVFIMIRILISFLEVPLHGHIHTHRPVERVEVVV